tara:strand:+ start:1824 stop:2111 length:288 start_codon:yes stop_codon:yes gene_type:complete
MLSKEYSDLPEPTTWWPSDVIDAIYASLTAEERLILRAITNGETNSQIAARLGIAEKSAEKHITRLFAKIGVSVRTKAAVFYTLWAATHQARAGT